MSGQGTFSLGIMRLIHHPWGIYVWGLRSPHPFNPLDVVHLNI